MGGVLLLAAHNGQGRSPGQRTQKARNGCSAMCNSNKKEFRIKKYKKAIRHYGTWGSQVIPQPSTSQAQLRLTSEF
jgi:hypothetical protein